MLNNGGTLLARISRSDVNTPGYGGLAFSSLFRDAQFKVTIYEKLRDHPKICVSELLFHRLPERRNQGETVALDGHHRQLFIFNRERGETNVWSQLDEALKVWSFLNVQSKTSHSTFNLT